MVINTFPTREPLATEQVSGLMSATDKQDLKAALEEISQLKQELSTLKTQYAALQTNYNTMLAKLKTAVFIE